MVTKFIAQTVRSCCFISRACSWFGNGSLLVLYQGLQGFAALSVKLLRLWRWIAPCNSPRVTEMFKSEARRLGGPSLAHKAAGSGLKAQGWLLFKAKARRTFDQKPGSSWLKIVLPQPLRPKLTGRRPELTPKPASSSLNKLKNM